jgi:hypothetical protein
MQTYNVSSFLRFLSCVVADSNRIRYTNQLDSSYDIWMKPMCDKVFFCPYMYTSKFGARHGHNSLLPADFVLLCSLDCNSLAWIHLIFVAKCIRFFV